jgi:hypothetical protein
MVAQNEKKDDLNWSNTETPSSLHPTSGASQTSNVGSTTTGTDDSSRGLGAAVKMLQGFFNRSGHKFDNEKRWAIEKAKKIIQSFKKAA